MITKQNKWALITGASSGIGKAFAERFAKEGWNIVLLARSEDKLTAIARVLEQKHQIKTVVLPADLSHDNLYRKIYEEIRGGGIVIDCLVNNAGFGAIGSFTRLDLERQLEMVDVNVKALVALTHLFLPGMVSQKHGMIINVSSTAGFQPMPYFSVYAASKAFVTSFSEAVASEFSEKGIQIINVCPGRTETNFGEAAGYEHHPLDKRPSQTAEEVVEEAFRAIARRRTASVITGLWNRALYYVEKLVPRSTVIQILKLSFKKLGYDK